MYRSQRFHFAWMQNPRAKAPGSMKATFGQSMPFGTLEEQTPNGHYLEKVGQCNPSVWFCRDGTKFEYGTCGTRGKDVLSMAFAQQYGA